MAVRMNGCLDRPVFFIGFMGAGKTSVSRYLARTCALGSVDLDTYLERSAGRRIKDIFAAEGEAAFRKMETQVLHELATKEPLLISCGGGVVVAKENREFLSKVGYVVHLGVTADEAKSRISNLSTRPLFNDIESARKLAEDRISLYVEVADVTVDTAQKSVAAIAREVQAILVKEGILWLQQK